MISMKRTTIAFGLWGVLPAMAMMSLAGGCGQLNARKQYELRGLIVEKNAAMNEITVNHEDVPGFMPAMTMPYKVRDTTGLHQVEVGDTITADIIVADPRTDYWLQNLKIIDSSKRGQILEQSEPQAAQPGTMIPDVPLINQDGKTIRLSQFKGKAVLVTFIYTRCPLPNFCPLISSHFAAIHRDLEKQPGIYGKTHLLSISFDPNYDKPPILKKYGLAYLDKPAGFAQWDFASPHPQDLRQLAQAFGLYYVQEGNQISHSMDTVLIAPDGKVTKSWLDNQWQVNEVLAALVSAAQPGKPVPAQDAHGQALYQMNCQGCHEGTNLDLVKQPPKLAGLYLHSKLPSGAPATDRQVRKTILAGRGIMPPFQQTLDKQDVDDLVQYLHTLQEGGQSSSASSAGHEISPP